MNDRIEPAPRAVRSDQRVVRYGPAMTGALLSTALVACGQDPGSVPPTAVSSSALCQLGGCDSAILSDTIPSTAAPGEKLLVEVEYTNSGTVTWNSDIRYRSRTVPNRLFGAWFDVVDGTVAPGDDYTFRLVFVAPTALGDQTYDYQTNDLTNNGFFGERLTRTVTIQNQARNWDCEFVSDTVPATVSPGELVNVTYELRNNGLLTWPSATFQLCEYDGRTWSSTRCLSLPSDVVDTATVTISEQLVAPTVPGTYSLLRQITDQAPTDRLGRISSDDCVDLTVDVVGGALLDASEVVADRDVPGSLAPGEIRPVSITMENTGANTWTSGGVTLVNTDGQLFGNAAPAVDTDVPAAGTFDFSFDIRAPTTPGSYDLRRRMNQPGGVGLFGDEVVIPITVSATVTPLFGAEVSSTNFPGNFTPSQTQSVSVTMENTGSATWSGSSFALVSTNTPNDLWFRTATTLPASCDPTAPGATCEFSFNVRAPADLGFYDASWQMANIGGVGNFGGQAVIADIEVTLCGNGIIDDTAVPPETCDYGDLIDGDGCSSVCQIEPKEVDLSADAADLTYRGSNQRRLLATVATGDIDGDGAIELLLGEAGHIDRDGIRNGAGRVAVYESPTFGGGAITLPTEADLEVWGAEAADALAAVYTSRIAAGDVTGDGIDDLVVSAVNADGASNARTSSGEVYILTGGSALTATAAVDLAAPGSFLGAEFLGEAANDLLTVLDVGDVTGDGTGDVILGIPGSNGGEGAVVVVEGGATLNSGSSFDLSTVGVYATITGDVSDRLGLIAKVGDVVGGPANDLIIAVARADAAGRSNAGAVYVFQGPLGSGVFDAAIDRDLEIQGADANAKLGSAVAVGNVRGSTRNDLVIGTPQGRIGGVQVGTVDIFEGPISIPVGGTIDLSATAPDTQIQGTDAGDRLGSSVAVGNYDIDAFEDIAVGTPLSDGPTNATASAGDVTVVLGRVDLAAVIDISTPQALPPLWVYGSGNDRVATYPSGLEFVDIDGNGVDDLCVGVARAGPNLDGEVYCFESQFF